MSRCTLSAIGLSIALGGQNLLTAELGVLSTIAVLPAVVGMAIGTRVRKKTSEQSFRRIFLIALGILGAYIVASSAYSLLQVPGVPDPVILEVPVPD